jgi:hypothetical protein
VSGIRLAALPLDTEAAVIATAELTGLPVYVSWTGDEWLMSEEAPDVACWVYMPPAMAQAMAQAA